MKQAARCGLFSQRSGALPAKVGEEWLSVHNMGVSQSAVGVARLGGKWRGRLSCLPDAWWPLGGDLDVKEPRELAKVYLPGSIQTVPQGRDRP